MRMLCILVTLFVLPVVAYAESKVITAEATYIMGDGETATFAEAMALQKAKQSAIEQAGTYVESYTQVKNLDLSVDEIRTVAGGVVEAEVLERKRTFAGDALRLYVKIRATVTTDKMEELARRIKGGTLAEDYKKLQTEFLKLSENLALLKREVAEAKTDQEREVVVEQIRSVEKQFTEVRHRESALHQRILSGQVLSVEADRQLQEQQQRRLRRKQALAHLMETIAQQGHTIEIGPPEVVTDLDKPDLVVLRFLVTARATEETITAAREAEEVYEGELSYAADRELEKFLNSLALVLTVVLRDGSQYRTVEQGFHNYEDPQGSRFRPRKAPSKGYFDVQIPRKLVERIVSVEGRIAP